MSLRALIGLGNYCVARQLAEATPRSHPSCLEWVASGTCYRQRGGINKYLQNRRLLPRGPPRKRGTCSVPPDRAESRAQSGKALYRFRHLRRDRIVSRHVPLVCQQLIFSQKLNHYLETFQTLYLNELRKAVGSGLVPTAVLALFAKELGTSPTDESSQS